jgi:hypothetical protein
MGALRSEIGNPITDHFPRDGPATPTVTQDKNRAFLAEFLSVRAAPSAIHHV